MGKNYHKLNFGRIFKGILFLFFTILSLKIGLVNMLSTSGAMIDQVNQKTQTLEKQNNQLNDEITKLGSLTRISNEAQKFGFINGGSMVNLASEVPIALRR